jgi:hypothetical protein
LTTGSLFWLIADMKQLNSFRIILGAGFVLLALTIFTKQLFNVDIDFGDFVLPVLIIIFGILELFKQKYLVGALALVVGASLFSSRYIQPLQAENVWTYISGFVLLLIGFKILTGSKRRITQQGVFSKEVYFSGSKDSINNDNFQGGNLTAFCGGIELNLTEANIQDEATLNITAIMGGVAIKVPNTWNIINKTEPIMGGFSDQRANKNIARDAEILIIEGDIIMGGVTVE